MNATVIPAAMAPRLRSALAILSPSELTLDPRYEALCRLVNRERRALRPAPLECPLLVPVGRAVFPSGSGLRARRSPAKSLLSCATLGKWSERAIADTRPC